MPLEEMPDHLIKAVLATEDRRFFEHFGIDVFGTLRALCENVARQRGGPGRLVASPSSSPRTCSSRNERTIERKIKEAFLALWLEANLSKDEILKLYLDRAYMGGGNFGVEAGVRVLFRQVGARTSNLAEAALLAGLFKAPTRYAPHINLPAARARANEVLTNMVAGGLPDRGPGDRRAPPARRRRRTGRRRRLARLLPRLGLRGGEERSRLDRRPRPDRPHHHRPRRCRSTAEEAVESTLRE